MYIRQLFMKLRLIIVAAVVLFACLGCARRSFRGNNRGVQRGGSYLGSSVASIINMFREEPVPMPKNYRR